MIGNTNENKELNLLADIAKVLTGTNEPNLIVKNLNGTFRRFASLDTLSIYIYDDNAKTLRDFSKTWVAPDELHQDVHIKELQTYFMQFGTKGDFFINDKPLRTENFALIRQGAFNDGRNTVLFPLMKGDKPFGILEMNFMSNISQMLTFEFFSSLFIAAYQISLKIQNSILANQMQKNIDFHESMKNIAKIIETQYELNYIIPLIGEMIDKFIADHLIYIFLKDEKTSKFKLVWPLSCRDERITGFLTTLTNSSKYILTDNGRMGFFPMMGETSLIGCIVAHSNADELTKKEIDYLEQLSQQSSTTIHRANVYAEVLQHATLDALTSLNNRRQFEIRLRQEVATAKRQHKPLCAMMIDVDFFKKVNDTYGHIVGDTVLKSISAVIKATVRESDIASRYGGEEFAILLPYTEINDAGIVAQRLRKAVEAEKIDISEVIESDVKLINVTISVGIYQFKDVDTPEELYHNADKALYGAKKNGRNKVMVLR